MYMANRLTYAPEGLVGVLTPQANTTVEPEFAVLLPPRVGLIAARLVSSRESLEDRLHDYFEHLDDTLDTFGGAPLGAVAVACTGPSYLIGPMAEDQLVDSLQRRRGVAVATAAQALVAALRALNAQRIALVSPYPAALTQASMGYWTARGFEVVAVQTVAAAKAGHHPIYAIESDAVTAALEGLKARLQAPGAPAADAVVLLGTGLPTLPALARPAPAEAANNPERPLLCANLALAWQAMEHLAGRPQAPSAQTLRALLTDAGWRLRLAQQWGGGG